MEGMLSPKFKEQIVGTAEIRETFKITKFGTMYMVKMVLYKFKS